MMLEDPSVSLVLCDGDDEVIKAALASEHLLLLSIWL